MRIMVSMDVVCVWFQYVCSMCTCVEHGFSMYVVCVHAWSMGLVCIYVCSMCTGEAILTCLFFFPAVTYSSAKPSDLIFILISYDLNCGATKPSSLVFRPFFFFFLFLLQLFVAPRGHPHTVAPAPGRTHRAYPAPARQQGLSVRRQNFAQVLALEGLTTIECVLLL